MNYQSFDLFSQPKGSLAKVSSSINLGTNARGVVGSNPGANSGSKESGGSNPAGGKISQHHSHSMTSLRKASISAPSHTVPLAGSVPIGQNSNFYLTKNDFG